MSIGVEPGDAHPARRQLIEHSWGMIVSRVGYYENDRHTPSETLYAALCVPLMSSSVSVPLYCVATLEATGLRLPKSSGVTVPPAGRFAAVINASA